MFPERLGYGEDFKLLICEGSCIGGLREEGLEICMSARADPARPGPPKNSRGKAGSN